MIRLSRSVAFRLALTSGLLVVGAIVVVSVVFYFGTVGIEARRIDRKIALIADRFSDSAKTNALAALAQRVDQALTDGIDSDTEIYYLADADGHRLTGNIAVTDADTRTLDKIVNRTVVRAGRPSFARLLMRRLPDGALLIIGRDMGDLNEVRNLAWRSIITGSLLAILLAIGGSLLFRRQIERRIFAIRHTAADIEAGNLSRRIPLSGDSDEFTRLAQDINRMLDRIEHLMDGVRHVSNTIAHNLRTPLGRIRGQLDEALRGLSTESGFAAVGGSAIRQIDDLIVVLEKLLQIAEAESGTRRQPFEPVSLKDVIVDVVELYDAAAESEGATLTWHADEEAIVLGDRDLLGSVLANLLDNALKYAGKPAHIEVTAESTADAVVLSVGDDGPGIPATERTRVLERFYRSHHGESGSGLGLSIVAAIAYLHGASLRLEDTAPGLCVRLSFARTESATFPNGNDSSMSTTGERI
ncbi:MAG: HAMP domain-containing histidine kinase [Rudaea sp.]|uniref:sensor histidine kinase n=1 Tax=unclassified Rudaea TaxID=2627037 RepID=UPI0010F9A164|nr:MULTISPECIES: HAMP domain-containing sensor histidine kinase [unclassified Rudaea]MBN8885681.1 HAMP domain-containing histidine kinase [Rudaea sp.]